MKPHRVYLILTVIAAALFALAMMAGCRGKGADTAKGIHDDTAIVGQHIEAAKTDVLKADEKVAAVAKAPDTTKASAATLNSARDDLSNARGNLIDAAEPLPAINAAADSLLDQLNAAKDEQRKHDMRLAAFITALLVATVVFLAIERAFPVTYLVAMAPAAAAGVVAFFAFGPVLAWVLGVLKIVAWVAGAAGAAALGLYLYKRARAGGWAGLVKNTAAELGKIPAAVHPDVTAAVAEFRRLFAGLSLPIPAVSTSGAVEGTGAAHTVNL